MVLMTSDLLGLGPRSSFVVIIIRCWFILQSLAAVIEINQLIKKGGHHVSGKSNRNSR